MKSFLINFVFVVILFFLFSLIDFDANRINFWFLLYALLWLTVVVILQINKKG